MQSIATVSHYRWTLPVLAELNGVTGSRFVPLAKRLGVSRDALRQTLDALIDSRLVMRNPGYGHPLRPEYILTPKGRRVASVCAALVTSVRKLGVEEIVLNKWSLPIIAALASERRYGDLQRAVGATPRALSLTLKQLIGAGLVERRVHDGFPPSTSYRVTPRSRGLRRHAARLGAAL